MAVAATSGDRVRAIAAMRVMFFMHPVSASRPGPLVDLEELRCGVGLDAVAVGCNLYLARRKAV